MLVLIKKCAFSRNRDESFYSHLVCPKLMLGIQCFKTMPSPNQTQNILHFFKYVNSLPGEYWFTYFKYTYRPIKAIAIGAYIAAIASTSGRPGLLHQAQNEFIIWSANIRILYHLYKLYELCTEVYWQVIVVKPLGHLTLSYTVHACICMLTYE